MQIVKEYPIQIEQWVHLPIDKFIGLISDNGCNYILGITPEDPNELECCYLLLLSQTALSGIVF